MTSTTRNSPLGSLLTRLATIEPREVSAVVASFLLFFFMWAGYFSVRPVRETIGTNLGRDATADLWLYTALFSILIIPLYGAVVGRFRRSAFLPWVYGLVAIVLAVIGIELSGGGLEQAAFNADPKLVLVGKTFYVFISVLNMFLLSVFWSFLLEIFDRGQTKRLFGVIAAGGSAGALVGPLVADQTVKTIGEHGILFASAGLFVIAIVCQRALLRIWKERPMAGAPASEDRPIGGNWFAGIVLILRSPYLIGIALFIVGISAVSTTLYFEQLRIVAATFTVSAERTQVFARMDWIVQSLTVLTQVFLTGRIAARFGVTTLLTFVPIMMIFGFLALAVNAGFLLFATVFVLRRAGEYAFVRPGREMLWSPLDKETKYKAKNTIDVPVYRTADAFFSQLDVKVGGPVDIALRSHGITAAGTMVIGAGFAALWGLVGWWLGRRFEGNEPTTRRVTAAVAQESKA
jgi:AAA family ATP:ADP antiporter